MKKKTEAGYNERLFSGGLRGILHEARYKWVSESIKRRNCSSDSILELGCFDGKIIDYLKVKPNHYLGLDANWEDGLNIAQTKWGEFSNYKFRMCSTPDEMGIEDSKYDICICMETLEHIPPDMAISYLKKLSMATKDCLFITVPNEIGVVFFLKYIVKRIKGDFQNFTFLEFLCQTIGLTKHVTRDGHKGFNYKHLVNDVSENFDILEVSGHPLRFAPPFLNFGIGIVAKRK